MLNISSVRTFSKINILIGVSRSYSTVNKLPYKSSIKESFKIWYEELSNFDDGDSIAQDNFLRYVLPYYNSKELVDDKYRYITAFNVKTQLKNLDDTNNQWYLNETRIEKKSKKGDNITNHLVMLHGYGASNGSFYKNFKGIIEGNGDNNLTIHGIDMLGFGLSGRPSIQFEHDKDTKPSLEIKTEGIKTKSGKYLVCIKCGGHLDGKRGKGIKWCHCSKGDGKDHIHHKSHTNIIVKKEDVYEYLQNQRDSIDEVENIYVESLEKWRAINKIEKFDLLAHSFGGYIGLSYLIKYPNRVNKIIMASPGGVERSPFAISNPIYKNIGKFDKGELKIPISNFVGSYGFLGRYGTIKQNFRNLWNMRISIFSLLRWIGPFGPKYLLDRNVVKLTKSGNIRDMKEFILFVKYVYSYSIRSSFSETSIMRIFDATVVGKIPILDKIREHGDLIKDKDFLWVYGEHDFMYKECGNEAIKELQAKKEVKKGEKVGKFEYCVVKNSGHNMYLENEIDFNRAVIEFLDYPMR